MDRNTTRNAFHRLWPILFFSGGALSICFSVLVLFGPSLLTIPIALPGRPVFFIVPNAVLQPVLFLLSLVIPFLTLCGFVMMGRSRTNGTLEKSLLPLGFLPMGASLLLLPVPPVRLASSALLILPACCLAASFVLVMNGLRDRLNRIAPLLTALGLVAVLVGLFTALGTSFNRRYGETEVDEGHYLIQAASLIRDGDLDIKNNLDFDLEIAIRSFINNHPEADSGRDLRPEALTYFRKRMHVSPKSPPGKWYSWHPFGLSIILAPTIPLGLLVRQCVLALISAGGCAVAFLLCVRMGNRPTPSLWVVLCTGLTLYWIAFSIRSLPEVLGASLLVMAYFAVHLYRQRPITALALFIPVCLFIPFAHPRFVVFDGVAVLMMILTVFVHSHHKRLLVYLAALLSCAALIVLAISYRVYGASLSSYPLHNLFYVYPEGAWLSFFSDRGLFYAFPFGAFLIIGNVIAFFRNPPNRLFYGGALLSVLLYIAIFSMMDCGDGGPTMAGRYTLAMTLILLPGGAWLLSRQGAISRWWLTLPSALSFHMFIWCMSHLEDVDKWWQKDPLLALRSTLPRFAAAFDPFGIGTPPVSILFLIAFTVFTLLVVLPASRRRWVNGVLIAIFVAIAVYSDIQSNRKTIVDLTPRGVDWIVSRLPSDHIRYLCPSATDDLVDPFNLANRFIYFGPVTGPEDDGQNGSDAVTVVDPFLPVCCRPASMLVSGTVSNGAPPELVVRQDERALLRRRISVGPDASYELRVQCDGMTLGTPVTVELLPGEDPGRITIDRFCWAPTMVADWIDLPEVPPAVSNADDVVAKEK